MLKKTKISQKNNNSTIKFAGILSDKDNKKGSTTFRVGFWFKLKKQILRINIKNDDKN